MVLTVSFDDQTHKIDISSEILEHGRKFFAQMDLDMDAGWKIGPEFFEQLDSQARAKVAASRLLIAIENKNQSMIEAMAGYIVSRIPKVSHIYIDTSGEPLKTEFTIGNDS